MGAHVREQESHVSMAPDEVDTLFPLEAFGVEYRPGMVDGKLLLLGCKFRHQHAAWVKLWMACHAKESARSVASMAGGKINMEVYEALTEAFGFNAANDAHKALSTLVERILAEPAKSPLGVLVKASVIFHEMFLPNQYTDVPEEDEDWNVKLMRLLIAELGAIGLGCTAMPEGRA